MGDVILNCPLCCDETFSSKQALIEHISNISQNLFCPLCTSKCSSLSSFVEHLRHSNCQQDETVHTISINPDVINGNLETLEEDSSNKDLLLNQNNDEDFSGHNDNLGTSFDGADVNKMYVELLSKQLMKPSLQTQEFKLMLEDGENRYVIVSPEAGMSSDTVVTKQNQDGTISLTTVKESKDDPTTADLELEDNQETYSCNTCGVTFTSVLDHIKNYHNDQDVVVEEPVEEQDNDSEMITDEFDPLDPEDVVSLDKQTSRRVITDTGDIVETPVLRKADVQQKAVPNELTKKIVVDKKGRVYTKRYIQVDELCESTVKDIKPTDDKDGPYHKVVMREVVTNGGKVKVYNCMSCNIFVSSLNEFKTYPCKTLKYNCPQCPVAYENYKSLCAHMKVHKSKEPVTELQPPVYECEICNTRFRTNKSLKLHKRMHDPIKVRPIEPPVETVDGTEVSEDKFLCEICHKLIPTDYKVIHQNSHKTSDKMNCGICNKKFTCNEYLEMHMRVHNLDKVTVNKSDKSLPYKCLYCNRRFARPHEKVKHERIHTGEKPHSCEICGKSFRVSYCLTLHMRTHTGARPYSCTICGKRFKAHSVYNHHLLTHSEVRAYKCPFCPKAFKTSVQLAGHKNSHTKPFSCQHCNRPFASLYAVRVHTETHARQNNLKFSCMLCGASYARAFALKDHVKQVHKQNADGADADNVFTLEDESKWMIKDNVAVDSDNKDLTHEVQLQI